MSSLGTIFDRLIGLLFYIACVLIGFSMLSVVAEILYRLFAGQSFRWVVEVTEYILLVMTFLGTAWVLRKEGHVSMDVLLVRLQPRTQALVNIVTSIAGLIICLVILWYGANVALENIEKGVRFYKAIGFPRGPIMSVIPLGCLLLAIQFIRRTRGFVRERKAPSVKEAKM